MSTKNRFPNLVEGFVARFAEPDKLRGARARALDYLNNNRPDGRAKLSYSSLHNSETGP